MPFKLCWFESVYFAHCVSVRRVQVRMAVVDCEDIEIKCKALSVIHVRLLRGFKATRYLTFALYNGFYDC